MSTLRYKTTLLHLSTQHTFTVQTGEIRTKGYRYSIRNFNDIFVLFKLNNDEIFCNSPSPCMSIVRG